MESYELRIDQPRAQRGEHGRFAKGFIPFNKGKDWSVWMPEEHRARVKAIGLKNLNHSREPRGKATYYKSVIAIDSGGNLTRHKSVKDAALFYHCSQFNVGRCCRQNRKGTEPTKDWKIINTNHRYMGIRFYFEDDVHLWSNARRK